MTSYNPSELLQEASYISIYPPNLALEIKIDPKPTIYMFRV